MLDSALPAEPDAQPIAAPVRHPQYWSQAKDDRLRELHAKGLKCSLISDILRAEFGGECTRNAVIGRAARIGLPQRIASPRRPAKAKAAPPLIAANKSNTYGGMFTKIKAARRKPKATFGFPALTRSSRWQIVEGVVAADLAPEPVPATRCTLFELKSESCRWPLWQADNQPKLFCGGESIEGASYCGFHCALSYVPPERRRR